LDAESLALFNKASAVWKDYRTVQVISEGDIYRGGSIRPFIHNSVFMRITEERMAAPSELYPEGEFKKYGLNLSTKDSK